MTTELGTQLRQLIAGADLSGLEWKVVTLDGIICSAANFNRAAGILRHGNPASYHVSAVCAGITKAFMGAACSSVGWPLKIANSGWLSPCASGDFSIGRLSNATCSSGDLAQVSVDFESPPSFIGL